MNSLLKVLAVAGATTIVAGTATAQSTTAELPRQMSWTAYDTGSAGYNQAVAIGAALQDATGVNLRVLPGKNDVSRTEPLRQGRVQFSATGVGGSFMAQEGAFQFGAENWGPQPIRVLMANNGGAINLAVGVADDLGIEEFSDLKGKRVAWVVGAPALNVNTEAYLAYGGLTWDDVERVDFGGFGASWKGLIEGQVDAAFASTNSGFAYEAETGPRGLFWPPIDPDNTEGLERMQSIAPFFNPNKAVVGATIDGTDGYQGAGYAYPVLVGTDETEADLAYNMTKAMVELYDAYAGKAPGINGWALDKQDMTWVVPYHEGAIRYYTEAGLWNDEAQAHNDNLIARQAALQAAWEELKAEGPDNWEEAWAEKRRAALEAGGFSVVF
ncbi:TAXI family TRAP transporter solute-binding subunit [Lutimaribacter sp. EGI FJ00015]|uniref:TAXI family TRAP transporter solute-binding subunit n=1 Tax=Lutimaribacter degradans TaxID=2945989 RepID=A0ACC5ZYP5_9RHOB|nr:TAXI family TRAP transporter solute-binding subunit [Lutimaribacter sp. EGI FJ00013]MCM2563172.1 TAXI family TRAP transporter solute-binding subunit [Lutimaribacter sp. EGI FJ00013]MCO0614351.1 TAXI family TRAP transporter solute-binding subunit [Lutimaribacter sp. EGI FJ00015]MCO0637161.1 TAXI family TRAP transporter solute-binding subunit [Lutimaribacter sp. EGI FJ00014]